MVSAKIATMFKNIILIFNSNCSRLNSNLPEVLQYFLKESGFQKIVSVERNYQQKKKKFALVHTQ